MIFEKKFSEAEDRILKEVTELRKDFVKEVAEVLREIGKLRTEIAESKVSILKYNLLFWTGQLAVTIGILALFYNILK